MTLKAHFDGKMFVPDEPVDMDAGQEVLVKVVQQPSRGMTGAETVQYLEAHPEIREYWEKFAAGRDSREVAADLRRQAQGFL